MSQLDAPAPLLHEIIALHGKWRSNRPALIFESEQLNWGEFVVSLNRFANALHAHGIEPGDKVVVLMVNGIPMAQALFGCMTAGCASVPINLSVSDEAVCNMIRDAGARAVVVTEDQQARIEPLMGSLMDVTQVFITTSSGGDGWIDWQEFHRGSDDLPSACEIADDDILNIIYSSGTTGLPKGIVHTCRGRRDWAYDLAIALRYHGGSRTLVTIGLYSNVSWVAMLCTLLAGGTLVIHRRFEGAAFLDTVAQERITHTAMVPIQYQRVIAEMEQGDYDVTSMQAMMSCGSPLHESLKQEIFEKFPCGVIELYGLTEGIITTLDPEEAHGRWSSVGKPLIGTDIKIIGDDNREVTTGESGEIVSKGRITMPGYLNRPDATEDVRWVDDNGNAWLRSGDIGRLDEEGFLYIVDRKKDMILSGGQNIYPQDIEAKLIDHEDVNDVAVIAGQSKRWGETPIAIVVPECERASREAIMAWCNKRVGKQQRIADVIFVDELPRNPNGKILKRELKAVYGETEYD